ncbi:hypothetical protein C8F01DRAFT_1082600 [Mycena amicta]|nr:hypothetical protein C8F01DRAFT_1082600 [Mycena amicta]
MALWVVQHDDPWYPVYGFPAEFWLPAGPNERSRGRLSSGWTNNIQERGRDLTDQIAHWRSDLSEAERSRLSNLGAALQQPPSDELLVPTLRRLRQIAPWDDTLADAVRVQYLIRERCAWFLWIQFWIDEVEELAELQRQVVEGSVDDRYMGCWINDAKEEAVLRLMKYGVPVFIVHRPQSRENFVTETPQDWLRSSTTWSDYFEHHPSRQTGGPITNEQDRIREARTLPSARSYVALTRSTPRPLLQHERPEAPPAPSTTRAATTESAPGTLRAATIPTTNPGHEYRTPCPIQDTDKKGSWDKYQWDDDTRDEPFFRYLGKKREITTSRVVFDRKRKRKIGLSSDFSIPPDAWIPDIYGFELPPASFLVESGNRWVSKTPSDWVYLQEGPTPQEHLLVGKPVEVTATTVSTGKGKARVVAERDEEAPSRVVRVQGSPLAIADFMAVVEIGQGVTWLEFESIEAAASRSALMRAASAPGTLYFGFRTTADFADVWEYSRDHWDPNLAAMIIEPLEKVSVNVSQTTMTPTPEKDAQVGEGAPGAQPEAPLSNPVTQPSKCLLEIPLEHHAVPCSFPSEDELLRGPVSGMNRTGGLDVTYQQRSIAADTARQRAGAPLQDVPVLLRNEFDHPRDVFAHLPEDHAHLLDTLVRHRAKPPLISRFGSVRRTLSARMEDRAVGSSSTVNADNRPRRRGTGGGQARRVWRMLVKHYESLKGAGMDLTEYEDMDFDDDDAGAE